MVNLKSLHIIRLQFMIKDIISSAKIKISVSYNLRSFWNTMLTCFFHTKHDKVRIGSMKVGEFVISSSMELNAITRQHNSNPAL